MVKYGKNISLPLLPVKTLYAHMLLSNIELTTSILLVTCLFAAFVFEFVNGFHDTANAVATVIYTHTLKPWVAVIWSGFCNFLGVLLGGITVAMGIVNLLPIELLIDQNIAHGISLVAAILITAVAWNLLTWYYGLPCSSSHTLIGSILGVGIAFTLLPHAEGVTINLTKAKEIGLALLVSPLFGFSATIVLMYFIRRITKKTEMRDMLFKEPKKHAPPPLLVRSILLTTCTLVSFSHGSNDGQKGVGLVMLILICILPSYYSINPGFDTGKTAGSLARIEQIVSRVDASPLSKTDQKKLADSRAMNTELQNIMTHAATAEAINPNLRFQVRKYTLMVNRNLSSLEHNPDLRMSESDKKMLYGELKSIRTITDYSPRWVIVMISLALGIGTMIGWKRIVKTVGEKIGKEHLTYAQGASAEAVAASTITLASQFGWPVSTTHVLSSGIAGSMVANKGMKNLQPQTIRNIMLAWVFTLPVVIITSGSIFLFLRWLF